MDDFLREKLYLFWVLDTCHVDPNIDVCEAVRSIKERFRTSFPNITIASMNAYGNMKRVSKAEIDTCYKNGFAITYVPGGIANAADTSIIIDMFKFDLEPPSLVMLNSGDVDFLKLRCYPHIGYEQPNVERVVLWDIDAFPLPSLDKVGCKDTPNVLTEPPPPSPAAAVAHHRSLTAGRRPPPPTGVAVFFLCSWFSRFEGLGLVFGIST
nr:hypothetical protein [Tanacetum cinerariifolium]